MRYRRTGLSGERVRGACPSVTVDYSNLDTLEITQEDRLLTVALNRPERLNAIGGGMHQHLEEFFYRASHDDSVGAIILTGNGRAFCAGGDVKMFADNATGGTTEMSAVHSPILGPKRLIMNMLEVEQPMIAAINGPAMGLGAS